MDAQTIAVREDGYDIRCIDEDYGVSGDFNTASAENLMITFELCDSTTGATCKSDEEIAKAMEYSYILIIENKESYKH